MLDMITPNFSRAEMACRCGCGFAPKPNDEFMQKLQLLRDRVGPLPITSCARCEEHNKREGGYPQSPHLEAKAAEIRIFGPRALKVIEEARRIGFSGIGVKQNGDKSKRFIHLDILPRVAIWSY